MLKKLCLGNINRYVFYTNQYKHLISKLKSYHFNNKKVSTIVYNVNNNFYSYIVIIYDESGKKINCRNFTDRH